MFSFSLLAGALAQNRAPFGMEKHSIHLSNTLIDGLVVSYLTFTALLSFWLLDAGHITGLHISLILGIFALRKIAWSGRQVCHDWYAVLLVPLLYGELDILRGVAKGRVYDELVLSWEHVLFSGSSPATWLSQEFPYLWLSEYLHFCYLVFYVLIPWVGYRIYRKSGAETFRLYVWSVMSPYLATYMVQMFFPVVGPRPLFPPLAEELQGPFWKFCHFLCGYGSSGAAAFPSSHVTVGVAVTIAAWYWDKKAFVCFLPITLGLSLCTVYGRFHYAVDAIAGALLAAFFLQWSPWFYRRLHNYVHGVSAV